MHQTWDFIYTKVIYVRYEKGPPPSWEPCKLLGIKYLLSVPQEKEKTVVCYCNAETCRSIKVEESQNKYILIYSSYGNTM